MVHKELFSVGTDLLSVGANSKEADFHGRPMKTVSCKYRLGKQVGMRNFLNELDSSKVLLR